MLKKRRQKKRKCQRKVHCHLRKKLGLLGVPPHLFEVRLNISFWRKSPSKGCHEAQHSSQKIEAVLSLDLDNFNSRLKAEELTASRVRSSPNI